MKGRTALYAIAALAWLGVAPAAAQKAAPPALTLQERLGYPASARLLIIHADDFGMDHSVNRAIIEALEHGWVTSASVMVPCPWFSEVAAWARAHPDADLGIHLVLTSEWTPFRWGPVSGREKVRSLLDAKGYLPLETDEVRKHDKPKEVQHELRTQIDFARAAGVNITHLDSHMGALFEAEPLFQIYRGLAKQYAVPQLLERMGEHGGAAAPAWTEPARKDALLDRVVQMQQGVPLEQWLDAYKKMLAPLPPGVYQLIVHLGYDDPEMQGATFDHPGWGSAWRQHDLDVVKSDEFRQFLKDQGFRLITWRELGKAPATTALP